MRRRKPRGLHMIGDRDTSSIEVWDGVTLRKRRVFSMKTVFSDDYQESTARLLRSDAVWLHRALTEWLAKGQKK